MLFVKPWPIISLSQNDWEPCLSTGTSSLAGWESLALEARILEFVTLSASFPAVSVAGLALPGLARLFQSLWQFEHDTLACLPLV
jgi:hypothetical protein